MVPFRLSTLPSQLLGSAGYGVGPDYKRGPSRMSGPWDYSVSPSPLDLGFSPFWLGLWGQEHLDLDFGLT